MATSTTKRPKGRPKAAPYKAFNFHCDADLHVWLNANRGELSMTQFLNQIIRERAQQ